MARKGWKRVVARTWRRRSSVRWVCQGGEEGIVEGARGRFVDYAEP